MFDQIPSETAANHWNKQSEEKAKTWRTEVKGFDASAKKFRKHFKRFLPRHSQRRNSLRTGGNSSLMNMRIGTCLSMSAIGE